MERIDGDDGFDEKSVCVLVTDGAAMLFCAELFAAAVVEIEPMNNSDRAYEIDVAVVLKMSSADIRVSSMRSARSESFVGDEWPEAGLGRHKDKHDAYRELYYELNNTLYKQQANPAASLYRNVKKFNRLHEMINFVADHKMVVIDSIWWS